VPRPVVRRTWPTKACSGNLLSKWRKAEVQLCVQNQVEIHEMCRMLSDAAIGALMQPQEYAPPSFSVLVHGHVG
jgi:hypothetical protein